MAGHLNGMCVSFPSVCQSKKGEIWHKKRLTKPFFIEILITVVHFAPLRLADLLSLCICAELSIPFWSVLLRPSKVYVCAQACVYLGLCVCVCVFQNMPVIL